MFGSFSGPDPADCVALKFMGTFSGDSQMFIEDVGIEKRKEFATKVLEMMKMGQIIFLINGAESRRIHSYDPVTNEWIVTATPIETPGVVQESDDIDVSNTTRPLEGSHKRGRPKKFGRVAARGTTAMNVPMIGGG